MMMCDCDGGSVAEMLGSNGATGEAGDIDAFSREGFLLVRFFDMGTEVGAGAGVGVGCGEAIAETGESASGD